MAEDITQKPIAIDYKDQNHPSDDFSSRSGQGEVSHPLLDEDDRNAHAKRIQQRRFESENRGWVKE